MAVTAQVAKRAVDEQLKSLGAHPIRRVATHHVGKGLSTTKISKKGKVHVKHGRKLSEKASKHIKKAVINEIKRIATHKPSEVVAKVHIARAKTAINAEVVKKAIVKQIKNKK